MSSMEEREGDRRTAERTRVSVVAQVDALLTIPPLELIEYQRDLDTLHTVLAGLLRHHRLAKRVARTADH